MLLEHQTEVLGRFRGLNQMGCFHPFGSGKTRIALEFVRERDGLPVVIFCRPDDEYTWVTEIVKAGLTNWIHEGQVTTVSYQELSLLPQRRKLLRPSELPRWFPPNTKAIVADESQFLKNHTSRRTRSAISLADFLRSKYRDPIICALSGFPAPQDTHEFFPQLNFLDGGQRLGRNFWHFAEDYATVRQDHWGHLKIMWLKAQTRRLLRDIGDICTFGLPDEVLKQLPPIERHQIKFQPTQTDLRHFQEAIEHYEIKHKGQYTYFENAMDTLHYIRQLSSGCPKPHYSFQPNAKHRWIKRQLGLKPTNPARWFKKAVIFSPYTNEVVGLAKWLGVPFMIGATPQKARIEIRTLFQHLYQAIVCQSDLGVGINEFSCADAVISVGHIWSIEKRQNCIGRIVRPNQTREASQLRVIDLLYLPIDEEILTAVEKRVSQVDWIRREGWKKWTGK